MKRSRKRVEINIEELHRVLDRARQEPIGEADYQKLKVALAVLAERLTPTRTTEKTRTVTPQTQLAQTPSTTPEPRESSTSKGHGRNGASEYTGARRVVIGQPDLACGDACPECARGKVYLQREPKTLVRIVGQAPVEATVFEMERLRCNACGQLFTAPEPEGIGPDKYDASATAMIAQLKYGTGVPFVRLERMEKQLGIPLPAATQWGLVERAAVWLQPAFEPLIRQAAQGEVLYNDDTGMRILRMAREPSDKRTGIFTSGIVSLWGNRRIALFFTGRQHAGENLADLLQRRAEQMSSPIQMCDALSRNPPKAANGIKILLANCMAHGRRQFVDVAASFPQECEYVLEALGMVYGNDALAREQGLDAESRLRFHQQYSGPLMEQLHGWLKEQLAEAKTEPNSGLGKAISYLLKHGQALTLFLREEGTPLDNNVCTAACGSAKIMPTPGLCRAEVVWSYCLRRFSDFWDSISLHNHRLSEKASRGSDGRKRSGVSPDEVAWASARSLSCISACNLDRSGSSLSIRGRAKEQSQ
jgi:transposase